MSKPKVGLVGFFGFGNFGDELFIKAHEEQLGEHFDLEVVNDLTEAPYLSPEREERLKDYDAFLIGGGDLINPKQVSKLYWRRAYLEKPTFVYSLGVPQPQSPETPAVGVYRDYFGSDAVKLIVARDRKSEVYINKTFECTDKTKYFPDAVCSLTLPQVKLESDQTLGVIIRAHRSVVGEYECIRAAVDRAKEIGYRIRIIVAANGKLGADDLAVSKTFRREDEELFYSEDLFEICKAIGECHMLMSMKFHGMIVATMYGRPSLQLSATPKNRNFLHYLQRPDLASNYKAENLPDLLPPRPAPIHSIIRAKLVRDSRAGYSVLREKLLETLG